MVGFVSKLRSVEVKGPDGIQAENSRRPARGGSTIATMFFPSSPAPQMFNFFNDPRIVVSAGPVTNSILSLSPFTSAFFLASTIASGTMSRPITCLHDADAFAA